MEPHTILHADMDAFYASVEQRDNPELRGKPVAVGGQPPRGVVSAASYEAREFGVHSAMPMVRALQLCPHLIVPPVRMGKYAQISRQVFEIFRSFSPLVEPLSLDEAFIDLSGTERLLGPAPHVARQIKQRVQHDLDLVVSIGVAPNKFCAKIASDLGKPDGLVVVKPDEVEAFLHPLSVSRVFGVGKKAQAALSAMGIETIGQLAEYPKDVLASRFGELGDHLWHLSRGLDDREVVPERAPKSIGHEDTFTSDLGSEDKEELTQIVLEQADRVAHRLRKHGYLARTVVLKAKTHDFQLITRRRSLARATCDGDVLGRIAGELLAKLLRKKALKLRLTGVAAADLEPTQAPRQLTFDEPKHEQKERLAEVMDSITDRFGRDTLMRASTLDRHKKREDDP